MGDENFNLDDICSTFVIPILSFFGLITNGLNMFIFLKCHQQDITHKYLFINSIAEFLYLLSCFFSVLAKCGNYCKIGNTYFAKVYDLVILQFLTSSVAIFIILIDTFISYQRYLIISNKKSFKNFSFKSVVISFCVLSILIYFPTLFAYSINIVNKSQFNNGSSFNLITEEIFIIERNTFGKSLIGKILLVCIAGIRSLLFFIVLFIINISTLHKFKKRMDSKLRLSNCAMGN